MMMAVASNDDPRLPPAEPRTLFGHDPSTQQGAEQIHAEAIHRLRMAKQFVLFVNVPTENGFEFAAITQIGGDPAARMTAYREISRTMAVVQEQLARQAAKEMQDWKRRES
jgi:2-methylisocitrate lyase-like PEP mutase family enzyme